MSLGNTKLVPYGIQTEDSLLRIHVCPVAKCMYVFEREKGLVAINSRRHYLASAKQRQYVTAKGFLVPPDEIEGCQCLRVPNAIWEEVGFKPTDSESEKGQKAEKVVDLYLSLYGLPVSSLIQASETVEAQLAGRDFSIEGGIQVKCDYRGGHKELGGTGYLFLQTQECNPFNKH